MGDSLREMLRAQEIGLIRKPQFVPDGLERDCRCIGDGGRPEDVAEVAADGSGERRAAQREAGRRARAAIGCDGDVAERPARQAAERIVEVPAVPPAVSPAVPPAVSPAVPPVVVIDVIPARVGKRERVVVDV